MSTLQHDRSKAMAEQPNNLTVMAVDDDGINLAILIKGVREAGYNVKEFDDMERAWNYVDQHPDNIDIALLDKMMPNMNGIDMLKKMKADDRLKHIPVILQTGDVGLEQMQEGLNAGAHYYLTKPFHPGVMNAIINSAAQECLVNKELKRQMRENQSAIDLLYKGSFRFRTRSEAKRICSVIANLSDEPESVSVGLIELLFNAIEHGSLEIGYEQKCKSLAEGNWEQEVWNRLNHDNYRNRYVELYFEKHDDRVDLAIIDQGQGFDWSRYMEIEPQSIRLDTPNGRGIVRARSSVLRDINYADSGNTVTCSIDLKGRN